MDKQTQKELLAIVKNNYDEIADEFSESRRKKIWPELVKLTDAVKEGDRILDLGCGNGRLLDALGRKKVIYLGIDSSKKLVHKAQALHIGYNFREGNMLELGNVPEMNFDFVYSIASFHHIPDENLRIEALKLLKNKINSNGKIIITVWNLWSSVQNKKKPYKKWIYKFWLLKLIKKNKMDFGDIIFGGFGGKGKDKSRRYYHAFRKRELKKLFKKAGLKVERLYKDQYNYYAVLKKM